MPSRRTHLIIGATSGVATGAYAARDQHLAGVLAEALGGGLGGAVASLAPDALEPAVSSWHRSTAHSYATAAAGVVAAARVLSSWQEWCRAEAKRHDRLREASADAWSRAWHLLSALLWRVISGLLVGAVSGYVSHLALDAATPRGIPLVV